MYVVLFNYMTYIYIILCSKLIIYLCICDDAVYLYLLTLNQTLAEGNLDYRDGHLIVNKTIGQRFAGKLSTRITDLLVDHRLTRTSKLMSNHGSHFTFRSFR